MIECARCPSRGVVRYVYARTYRYVDTRYVPVLEYRYDVPMIVTMYRTGTRTT